MTLKLLVDENLRSQALRNAIQKIADRCPLDVLFVGDVEALPLGSPDAEIMRYARESQRIVVSGDFKTLSSALRAELDEGFDHPGVIHLRGGLSFRDKAEWLALVAHSSIAADWQNQVSWLP